MKPKCVNCGHDSTDHAYVALEQPLPNCQKCDCKQYKEEIEEPKELFDMHWVKRRTKLAKVLATIGVEDPHKVAQFVMECNFDYVPYVASLATMETIKRHKERLKVDFDD